MKQKIYRRPVADVLFVLILFLVFTLCSLSVVLVGARVYQSTSSRMNENYTIRTALAYVSEKMRHYDQADSVFSSKLDKIPALAFSQEINGESYTTYIYFHDNALKELLVKTSSHPSPEQGTRIVELEDFSYEELSQGFYRLTATDFGGESFSMLLKPKSQ